MTLDHIKDDLMQANYCQPTAPIAMAFYLGRAIVFALLEINRSIRQASDLQVNR